VLPRAWRHRRPARWLQAGQLVSGKIPQNAQVEPPLLGFNLVFHDCGCLQGMRAPPPPPSSDSNASSRVTARASKVIGEIKPGAPEGLVEVQGGCYLEKIGTRQVTKGSHVGRECGVQQRCKVCLKNRADGGKSRRRRTAWRRHYHPEVPVYPAGKRQCLTLHQHYQGQI
jgi:hypothetical protein